MNTVLEYSDEFGEDWPLTDKEISILDKNRGSLVDLLELKDLLGPLFASKVINKRQTETISSKQTSHERNDILLDILRRRSLQDYHNTIKRLCESQQRHIAEILDNGGGRTHNVKASQVQLLFTSSPLSVERHLRLTRMRCAKDENATISFQRTSFAVGTQPFSHTFFTLCIVFGSIISEVIFL